MTAKKTQTIDDIQTARDTLADEIVQKVTEFEKKYGVEINSMHAHRQRRDESWGQVTIRLGL